MRITRARMLSLSTVIIALGLGATAIPAQAADATLSISGPTAVAVDPDPLNADRGAPGGYLSLDFTLSNTDAQLNSAVVQIDISTLKGVADVQAPYGCTATATALSCPQVFLLQGHGQVALQLTAAKGGTPGTTATLHTSAHLSSGNTTPVTYDTKVMLGGSRLQWNDVPVNQSLKPGDTWAPELTVTNAGQLPAPQLVLTFVGGMGLNLKSRFSNCEYGTSDHGDAAICVINSTVAPGETVRLDPIQFGVDPSAYLAYEDPGVSTTAPGPDTWLRKSFHYTPGPVGSPRVTVGKPETTPSPTGVMDLPLHGGYGGLRAIVPNTTDFAAFGAWAPEKSGKQGKLTAGMTSSGPASILWRAGGYPANVAVTLPKQVSVIAAPANCSKDDRYFKSDSTITYICLTSPWIPAGYKASFDFTLGTEGVTDASAVVTLPSIDESGQESGKPWDPNKANDTVTVALGSKASGSVPTGGATPPPSTKPGPPASATASAPGTRSASPTSTAPTASTSASSSSSRNGLASTGADGIGTMLALGGGAIVLGGGVLLLAARRRKAGAHE